METEITLPFNQWALAGGIFLAFVYYAERLIAACERRTASSKGQPRSLKLPLPIPMPDSKVLQIGLGLVLGALIAYSMFSRSRR